MRYGPASSGPLSPALRGARSSESLVLLVETTDLVGRVVVFEEIEQTLEDPHTFLAARARDAEDGVAMTQHSPADRLGGRALVAVGQLARGRPHLVVEEESRSHGNMSWLPSLHKMCYFGRGNLSNRPPVAGRRIGSERPCRPASAPGLDAIGGSGMVPFVRRHGAQSLASRSDPGRGGAARAVMLDNLGAGKMAGSVCAY